MGDNREKFQNMDVVMATLDFDPKWRNMDFFVCIHGNHTPTYILYLKILMDIWQGQTKSFSSIYYTCIYILYKSA